ncbi:flavodoxin [Lactobacillus sp.]|uniref:flavodoxin n=1 Tax=Lactobacillus sp. TaxID=1591 RepID=UPI0019C9CAD1|nr:flavodoxin [Lactobacillus sp.]MBD5430195.1 flavodoxin [Lactobacillus sp.]
MNFLKRIALLLGFVAIAGGLAACSNSKSSTNSSQSSKKVSKVNKTSKNSKTLILYFSLSGSTKEAAEYIQKETGADMIRLQPVKAYKGYDDAAKRGDRERRKNIHPALKTKIPNFSKYENVIIGYPTWWSRPPMLISTLFDDYNFKGKNVTAFTTSMSTPIGPSEQYIRRMAQNEGADFVNGIRYDNNKSEVRQWLKKIGLLKEN